MIKATKGEKVFYFINGLILILVGITMIYPLIYVLSASLSSSDMVTTGQVILFPKEVTLNAYKKVLEDNSIWIAYLNTIFYTMAGTAFSMLISVLGAYPLSKKRLMGRSFLALMLVFTMWFNAGTIPTYLNLRSLHLLNTRFAIVVAFAVSAFNVVLLRNFFESVPQAMEEAAMIDGANDFYILYRIYMPLSLPSLATVALFYAVSRWNGYFWAMIILKDDMKIPLQVLLKKLIVDLTAINNDVDIMQKTGKETVTYATIFISILPMLAIYPYIQKYFVKGVMIGAVKE